MRIHQTPYSVPLPDKFRFKDNERPQKESCYISQTKTIIEATLAEIAELEKESPDIRTNPDVTIIETE